jgi:hypothetical protein
LTKEREEIKMVDFEHGDDEEDEEWENIDDNGNEDNDDDDEDNIINVEVYNESSDDAPRKFKK